jgi:hypothetical protein
LRLHPLFERFEAIDNESGKVSDTLDAGLAAADAVGGRSDCPSEAFDLVGEIDDVERLV